MASLKRKKVSNSSAKDGALLFHAMYVMSAIDGSTSTEEAIVLRGILASLPDFRNVDLDGLMAQSNALIKKHGGVIESIEAFSDLSKGIEVRHRAFILAVEVAYASGTVNPAEEQLLDSIGNILALDEGVREGIISVMSFKYAQS